MSITLTPSQEEWIRDRVASGAFASIEDAARQLIDDRIAEIRLLENDDMAWAKPFVDEAREAVARGDILTAEEHRSRNEKRLSVLRPWRGSF